MLRLLFSVMPRREAGNLETYMVLWEEERPQAKNVIKEFGGEGRAVVKIKWQRQWKKRKEKIQGSLLNHWHFHALTSYRQQNLHDPLPPPTTHFLLKSQQWTDVSSISGDIFLRYLILIALHDSTVSYFADSCYPNFPYSKWTASHF